MPSPGMRETDGWMDGMKKMTAAQGVWMREGNKDFKDGKGELHKKGRGK